jgi:hypothetical protein
VPTVDPTAGQVRVAREGRLVTISLRGRLDAHAGVELLSSLQEEVEAAPERIDLDLRGIDDWTPEGARALRRAQRLASVLADGMRYRCVAGAGHDALLEAFSDDDE